MLAFCGPMAVMGDQAPEIINYKGAKADASRLIVKLKQEHNMAARSQQAGFGELIAEAGMEVDKRRFRTMPDVRILRLADHAGSQAQSGTNSARSPKRAGSGKSAKPAFANEKQLGQTIQQLMASGRFEYVEPDWMVYSQQAPTDAALTDGRLWGLRNSGQNGGTAGIDVNADNAWAQTLGDDSIIVGVIDTGVRYTHQDLAANMWVNPGEIPGNNIDDDNNGYVDDVHGINAITNSGDPMDDNGHGTHVAGTIAATADNGHPLVGVAPGSRIMALKFLDADGSGRTSDAITCLDYATMMGAQITNNSWGGGGFSQALLEAIQRADDAGSLFVAAAGNASQNNDSRASFPANYQVENVISVAAIDRNGDLASFSNFGQQTVDLAAPGVAIFSAVASSDTAYDNYDGTSMAAPHVAGAAALVLSQHGPMSLSELRSRLLISAVPFDGLNGLVATAGRADAQAAIDLATDGILELRAGSDGRVDGNRSEPFYISVTDLSPVLDAIVTSDPGGGNVVAFLDDGVAPDFRAGDGIYAANLTTGSVSPFAFTVDVTAPGKQSLSQSFEFQLVSPPANDNFTDRILLAPGSTQSSGSNQYASVETGEGDHPSASGPNSVWWEWIAPSAGSYTISTAGSNFDTTLAIYQGSSLSGLSLLGSNDDAENGLQSTVTFAATANSSYQIRVAGYQNSTGNINLNYPPPASGVTDGSPFFISQPPANLSLIVGSTLSLKVAASGDSPISYQWFFNGVPISGATGDTLTIPNTTTSNSGAYTATITNSVGSSTSQPANVRIEPVGVIAGNDNFANAETLSGFSGTVKGNNARATAESLEPDHLGISSPVNSLWWTWTPPFDGSMELDTFGSSFDTTLAVYTGDSLSSLSLIAGNDDTDGTRSRVAFNFTQGEQFRIAVDGFGNATGDVVLNYQVSVQPLLSFVGNDLFANRTDLGQVTRLSADGGNNSLAGGEAGEPDHAARSAPLQSLWWTWTAPTAGSVTLSTIGSDFDTTLATYTGSFVGALSLIAQNDDAEGTLSRVTFSTTAGTAYQIAVDGFENETGNITFNLDFTPDVSLPPAERLEAALLGAGLSGPQLDPESRPFGDGLENILKYAFNLQLDRADRTLLNANDPTDTSGLPVFDLIEGSNGARYLRVAFLRNVDYGLNYTAFITQDLLSSNTMNAPENVLNLGNGWQRVVIDQPIPDPELPVFGFLRVTLP